MQEKKGDAGCKGKKVKKTNLLDQHSIKHLLDESVSEIVTSRGYAEDFAMSNIRLLLGTVVIAIALFAQFYNKKFPENRNILIVCISLYIIVSALLLLIPYTKEKNAILFTYPPAGSFSSTGLVVSSKLPRFSDMYTLMIASADPQSISAKPPVEFTKTVTQWFTKDGVLAEGLFWKDVEALISNYAKENKKGK
ncbi:probable signal peptidase complex subunit 2 [Ipomoea triloba]|uniref:probable signal peptidase complex subunit 2 n=1 Tax=Ipomoea triloba TaxID=35885 RepID=UPI00125D7613|nr:probable signal peptidase complex subunit 2 [Ipomoea triloba]